MIFAFDFDGTLCDITHRLHYINGKPKDWPAFFRACVHDKPVPAVIAAAQALGHMGHRIEVWSGRSDAVRTESEAWLNRHAVPHALLRMRKDGDYRADHIVKAEWLGDIPIKERPVLAFDDRARVVEMWRENGVQCAQVATGDF